MARVFISGGTGYLGGALCPLLLARGQRVRLLTRAASRHKVPAGAEAVLADALNGESFASAVSGEETFVQLTGTPHPAPWKEAAFRAVDLASCRASVLAAQRAGVRHFVYVSVAHPAPVMRAYIAVRRECEHMLADAGFRSTILRPWYVLGPGHRWPMALKPAYALLERLPPTRAGALRLGLVTLQEMVAAITWAIEHPPEQSRVIEVPEIRQLAARL
jgi:uncharacterized protein YbjT (DUF2867 family)